jgi:hypothetical protein
MMPAEDLIERMLAGESASEVLQEAGPPNPFALRKYVRDTAPALHKFLQKRGDLHDFSLVLVTGNPTAKDLLKTQDIPKQYEKDVSNLLAGLEED